MEDAIKEHVEMNARAYIVACRLMNIVDLEDCVQQTTTQTHNLMFYVHWQQPMCPKED